ncbi:MULTISPECIES: hypothetical protein [Streptomyces]|uniref:hypothetical protein n=1 Tax=Streptomyces TaxID=1883 RepID=UPI000F29B02C|nr:MULTISPECIES: hypothetical protein [Streptomyces]MCX4431540.1 hypothetical protein [Streptomyces mirabilis]
MPEEPTPGPLGTEMREATLPDGARVVVAVKPGLPQDGVDLIAATVWAELPEG